MNGLTLISPPDGEPITRDEAKTHLRVELEHYEEDDYINSLITAARQEIETESDNIFKRQVWELSLDCFPYCEILLRKHPVLDVDEITYYDADGAVQTLSSSLYQTDLTGHFARVLPAPGQSWPSVQSGRAGAVKVRFTAGHEDTPGGIPGDLIHALKLRVANKYEDREDERIGVVAQRVVDASDRLIARHRVPRI